MWLLPWLICMVTMGMPGYAQTKNAIRKVVIDAGHGGHDPGALGRKVKEKNLNLSIALKLGNMIQRNYKDIRVIYTRDRDFFVELDRRSEIANESKADLFISIHCNANNLRSLKGAETYVMGLHKSKANLEIAKQENASILLESDYTSRYDGFDPNNDESYIIFSLFQNSNLDQSMNFAAEIQEQLEERVGLNNRGVRQAGFIVLYKTTMPSVLIEAGYLSNASDEAFLMTDKGQEYIATAIFRAFKKYKEKTENPGLASEPLLSRDNLKHETTRVSRPPYDSSPIVLPDKKTKTPTGTEKIVYPTNDQANSGDALRFRVQIASTSVDIGTNSVRFSAFSNVQMYRHGGMFKYTVGNEKSLKEAEQLLRQVKGKGIKDAFIVIFRNDERISQTDANIIMGK